MGGGAGEGEVILVRNLLVGNGINIPFDAKITPGKKLF